MPSFIGTGINSHLFRYFFYLYPLKITALKVELLFLFRLNGVIFIKELASFGRQYILIRIILHGLSLNILTVNFNYTLFKALLNNVNNNYDLDNYDVDRFAEFAPIV